MIRFPFSPLQQSAVGITLNIFNSWRNARLRRGAWPLNGGSKAKPKTDYRTSLPSSTAGESLERPGIYVICCNVRWWRPPRITIIGHRSKLFFGLIIRLRFVSVHQSVGLGNVSSEACCVITYYKGGFWNSFRW